MCVCVCTRACEHAHMRLTYHEVGDGREDTEGYSPDDQHVRDALGNEEHGNSVVTT